MSFERVFSGAPWEEIVGYCRVLRAGKLVFVTGTAPVNPDGGVHAPGNALGSNVEDGRPAATRRRAVRRKER